MSTMILNQNSTDSLKLALIKQDLNLGDQIPEPDIIQQEKTQTQIQSYTQ